MHLRKEIKVDMQYLKVKHVFLVGFLLVSFIYKPLNAQDWKVDLKPAISIAVGEFAASKLYTGSFAETGFVGSVLLSKNLYEKWSFSIEAGQALHAVNIAALGLVTVQSDPFMEDVYIRSEAINNMFLLAGPSYTFKLSNKFNAETALRAGIMRSKTPYQLYKPAYFLTGPEYFEITSAKDFVFAFAAEGALFYTLNNCYQAGINIQWLSANPAFDFQTFNGIRTDIRPVRLLNIGFVWRFHL